jgi:hypothetical protein
MQHKTTPFFHFRMLRYFTMYSSAEEFNDIAHNDKILHLHLESGIYSIKYSELVEKATEEADKLRMKYNIAKSLEELLTENDEFTEEE